MFSCSSDDVQMVDDKTVYIPNFFLFVGNEKGYKFKVRTDESMMAWSSLGSSACRVRNPPHLAKQCKKKKKNSKFTPPYWLSLSKLHVKKLIWLRCHIQYISISESKESEKFFLTLKITRLIFANPWTFAPKYVGPLKKMDILMGKQTQFAFMSDIFIKNCYSK